MKQSLSAARAAGADEPNQLKAVRAAVRALDAFSLDMPPALNSTLALWAAHQALGNNDPFARQKEHYNALALQLYPNLKRMVATSEDRLGTAVKLAVAGNVIDLGILGHMSGHDVDIEKAVAEVFAQGLAICHLEALRHALNGSRRVLFLGDNAGEIVFDRILVEEITAGGAEVTFAVKSQPILNDVTLKDAEEVEMSRLARVVTTGSGEIGLRLSSCAEDFREEFATADLILSKGQGHFETLDDVPAPVFFLLKAKCEVTADALEVEQGRMVLMQSRAWKAKEADLQ